jgi:hypothetical protein
MRIPTHSKIEREWVGNTRINFDLFVNVSSTAGWSSGLRTTKLEVPVKIPVLSRGFCDEQLHLLKSHGCLYILYYYQHNSYIFTIYVCLSVI